MKFNTRPAGAATVKNHEGAKAWTMSKELELYSAVVTTTLSDKFYETGSERMNRIRTLVREVNPQFVAKLAVYARESMYLRSVPLVLAVELARIHQGDDLVSRLVARVIQRADEITEILALYQHANERKSLKKLGRLSKQLQKGLALAFNKFDEYQFSKYNRDADVKLRDALFLVHPRPKNDAQQMLFDKIAKDSLDTAYTWETEMSRAGQEAQGDEADKNLAFAKQWEALIDSGKLGYMAMLRNLRNMLQKGISDAHLDKVGALLADPNEVRKSKQFPFRFLAAYRELGAQSNLRVPQVLEALEKAIRLSVANMKGFDRDTRILIACDVSGSMQTAVSAKSKIQMYDIGLVLSMLLQSKCERAITSIFGTEFKVVNMPRTDILANTERMGHYGSQVGWATNGHLVVRHLNHTKEIVDKVMIFTDMQLWNSKGDGGELGKEWTQYKKIAPKAKLYIFDLQGYGQAPINPLRNDVCLIAGWSDKVFDILHALENGSNALEVIDKIVI
ncbi:MAG: TROVE domain-containing protein [Bacteroidia bacterium]